MPKFIHGLSLNREFYNDVVRELMEKNFPELKYSVGLLGHGSDVIGFDSPTSMDHNWGPHLHLFFSEADFIRYRKNVDEMLQTKLPYTYKGFSTNFVQGDRYNKDISKLITKGRVHHLFEFWTPRSFFIHYLGFDIQNKPTYPDWLLFPQQALIDVTTGELFRDDLGVKDLQKKFDYYPQDVWKYMLRCQWGKILDELQMQARTGQEKDELGSRVVVGRLVHRIMLLCFLLDRKYTNYTKWFGKAFARLPSGKKVYTQLLNLLEEKDWRQRQEKLAKIYQILGRIHNSLHITEKVSTKIIDYFGRGYPIVDLWNFVEALEKSIKNQKLRNMKYPLGSIDQIIDNARINQQNYFYIELKDIIE